MFLPLLLVTYLRLGCVFCCPQMVREGTDVSIFTYSRMRYVVMQAVAELEKKGYNPEVGLLLLVVIMM
jgi:pyruvate/2-oxoglutarate/acetoin dehydrogenase E1 component